MPPLRGDLLATLGSFNAAQPGIRRRRAVHAQQMLARFASGARPSVRRRLTAARATVTKAGRLAVCTHSKRAECDQRKNRAASSCLLFSLSQREATAHAESTSGGRLATLKGSALYRNDPAI